MAKAEISVLSHAASAVDAVLRLRDAAKTAVAREVARSGGVDQAQDAAHGFAWLATYVEALVQMLAWARKLDAEGRFGEVEHLLTEIAFSEYLAQIAGGI